MDENQDKKKNPLLRLLACLVTAALLLTAVFLLMNWRKLNFDFIRRYFTYRALERNASGQVESFSYNGGASSAFAQLGDDLLVCSGSGIWLYAPTGGAYLEDACALARPVIHTAGTTALIYDAGGTDLYVYRDREQVFSLTTEVNRAILSASLSAQGQLTVVTQASGLKGVATVYSTSFQPLWSVNLSSRFITDAILSPDGSTLALATAGQTGGIYDSQISFYSSDRASAEGQTPDAVCSLGNNTILALDWHDHTLRVLGEDSLDLVSKGGELIASYPYGGRYLKGFSLSGSGFSSLLLGRYRAGTDAQLVTVDDQGTELASVPLDQQVLSLSSSGRYTSLLTPDGLSIYTQELEPYHDMAATQGVRKLLQREDGSVFLISAETARLYLPD